MTDQRRELIAALARAAEFEHAAVLEYLFVSASLKRRPDEGLNRLQLERIRIWERTLLAIAREEMAHLATVSNLMIGLGARPHLLPPSLILAPDEDAPAGAAGAPVLVLERFGDRSLGRLIELEGSEAGSGRVGAKARGAVGDHYQAIKARLVELARVEDAVVSTKPMDLVDSWGVSGNARFAPITDTTSALSAIDSIVGQSEGVEAADAGSHLGRLLAMREELATVQASDGPFDPARRVVTNPTVRGSGRGGATEIDVEYTAEVAGVYADAYTAMILLTDLHYHLAQGTSPARHPLRRLVQGLMTGILRPLGEVLTELPALRDAPEQKAGPVFDFDGVDNAQLEDAWEAPTARLRHASAALQRLAREASAPGRLGLIAENLQFAGRLALTGRDHS